MTSTRGILRPTIGLTHFELDRRAAPDDLSGFVDWLWTVRWDLPAGQTFEQETLPFPCVHLVYEEGQCRVHGPGTRRFVARLRGKAWVTGVRFKPAGFSAFSRLPMRDLADRVMRADEVLGRAAPPAPPGPDEAPGRLCDYLRALGPSRSEEAALADRLVAAAQSDRGILKASDLARFGGLSLRSMHRLLERHVGVSSKWIVRRARVHEAAERVARGERVDWAAVALELGYHDQAHLIRDFREQIGDTPAAYARRCAGHGKRLAVSNENSNRQRLHKVAPPSNMGTKDGDSRP